MMNVQVTIICILALLCNLMLPPYTSAEMQGERPESPITATTDKSNYFTGEIVKIRGSVPILNNGHEVNVIVKDANGGTFTKLRVKPTSDSKFETSFQIPPYDKLLPTGRWTISIGYAIWATKLEINILASENTAVDSVTLSKPELVTKMQKIRAGDDVVIVSKVKNNEEREQRIFYIVKIEDVLGTTIFLDWFARTLGAQETAEFSVSWVPEIKGEYALEIFVWSDIKTPTPLSTSQSINQTITS